MSEENVYDYIIREAEKGNPHCMFELANLYKAGVFGEDKYDQYVYWLESFFKTPLVMKYTEEYDEANEDDVNDASENSSEQEDEQGWDMMDDWILRDDIIEAGAALAVYYSGSTNVEELIIARDSIMCAMIASRFADTAWTENGEEIKILDIFNMLSERFVEYGIGGLQET